MHGNVISKGSGRFENRIAGSRVQTTSYVLPGDNKEANYMAKHPRLLKAPSCLSCPAMTQNNNHQNKTLDPYLFSETVDDSHLVLWNSIEVNGYRQQLKSFPIPTKQLTVSVGGNALQETWVM